jgi:glycosyltransferase involved in cell wall biosynthesis
MREFRAAQDGTAEISVVVPTIDGRPFDTTLLFNQLAAHLRCRFELVVVKQDTRSETASASGETTTSLVTLNSRDREAGKLRNYAATHARGEYIFFLDDDDEIDASALANALERSREARWDSAVFPYRLVTASKKPVAHSMTEHDCRIWPSISPNGLADQLRNQLLRLGNYPWIRLTKTSFLREHSLKFGLTDVHNDIRFHWHSLVAAESLGVTQEVVCTHFLREGPGQLTSVRDERRLQVFDALAETYATISTYPRYAEIRETWISFCREIIAWAKDNIERKHLSEFKRRAKNFRPEGPKPHTTSTGFGNLKGLLHKLTGR